MEDIKVWSFETYGIQRQAVVLYGKVYTYVLVTNMVKTKNII